MVVVVISDGSFVSIAQNLLGFHAGTDLLRSPNLCVIYGCISPSSVLGGLRQAVSAGITPPPAIRLPTRTAPMAFSRKMRRAKRRHRSEDGGGDFEDLDGGSGGGGDDGSYGNGRDGGGGDWSFGSGAEGSNADPAFDFVYEVISWLALSQCLQFAFKRFVLFLEDRDKVPSLSLNDLFSFRTSTARVAN